MQHPHPSFLHMCSAAFQLSAERARKDIRSLASSLSLPLSFLSLSLLSCRINLAVNDCHLVKHFRVVLFMQSSCRAALQSSTPVSHRYCNQLQDCKLSKEVLALQRTLCALEVLCNWFLARTAAECKGVRCGVYATQAPNRQPSTTTLSTTTTTTTTMSSLIFPS